MLKDEQKEQAAKLKNRSFTEKLSYFWTYNKGPVIIIIVIAIFAVGIWQSSTKYDRDALQVVITDHKGKDIQTDTLTSLYEASSENPGSVYFDTGLWLCSDNYESTVAYVQKLVAMLNTNSIDIFIAPESIFEQYGKQGMFTDLNTLLTADEITGLNSKNCVYYAQIADDETVDDGSADHRAPDAGNFVAAGIRLEGSQLLAEAGIQVENACIGIPATAAHPEDALRFLNLFIQETNGGR